MGGAERHNNEDGECGNNHDQRRNPKDKWVGLGGHNVFLDQQLKCVRYGLQQAMRPNSHRTQTDLHVGQNFPFQPVHRNHCDGKTQKNKHDIDKRPEQIACLSRRRLALEVRGDVFEH